MPRLLFFLLPLVYFLLYGNVGFADTDQGFVPALSWRVLCGEVPYVDFCYVRPPLTPWLHALELWVWPRNWEMLGMRLDFYLMVWASCLFGILTLRRLFAFPADGISIWMLGSLAFLFSAHNFPAMPWHTVDGIFFASLGVYLLSHPRARWQMVLGLGALALSGLAKQPFAILLPLGIALMFVLHSPKIALKVTAFALIGLGAGAAVVLYAWLPARFLEAMLAQTAGASSLGELARTGLVNYLYPGGILFFGLVALYAYGARKAVGGKYLHRLSLFLRLLFVLYPLGMASLALWKGEFMPPRGGFYHALLGCVLLMAVSVWRKGERKQAAMLLMLGAISWASSLSWGYATPALFALPGIFAFHNFLKFSPGYHMRKLSTIAALLVFLGFFLLQLYPYRDAPRWQLVSGAGEVFPALSYIRTSPENIAKLQEYKDFRTKFPQLAVLPAMPAADYLMGLKPVLPIDWEHDAEVGASELSQVIREMNQYDAIVLVELSRMDEATSTNLHYHSELLHEVLETWTRANKGRYFQMYLKR